MTEGFWQRRFSRRRLLTGAASAALVGTGVSIWVPGRSPISPSRPQRGAPVIADEILHSPADLAKGDLRGLAWHAGEGAPGLRAGAFSEGILTSPVVRTRLPCTHVGLHWRSDGSDSGLRFELRTSQDGTTWSSWHRVDVDSLPPETSRGETFGALVWADRASYVQYRALFDPAATEGAPVLHNVAVTALTVAPADELRPAAAATRTPRVTRTPPPTSDAWKLDPPFGSGQLMTREDWGAPENYRFDAYGAEVWPRMYVPTKKIAIHHTATLANDNAQDPKYPYPNYTPEMALQDVHAVYYYHAITKGWGDIGYNALIDRFGTVYEGRRGRDDGPNGGRDIISADVVAGHALNCNEGATGVSLIGNFDVNAFGDDEEDDMIPALIDYLVWSCRRYYIHPSGSSDFLMVNLGSVLNMPNISGHRDCNSTSCPGGYAYQELSDWRRTVGQRIGRVARVAPTAQITTVPGAAEIEQGRVTFAWKSPDKPSAEFSYYIEGWLGNLDTDTIYYITGFTDDKRPDWSSFSSNDSVTLNLPEPGRYTFHVRARDPDTDNEGAFEMNHTFISYTGAPTTHKIGVPGITKN